MQNVVKEFNEKIMCPNENMQETVRVLDIQSEFGELSKEILKASNYGISKFVVSEDFEMEFGDVLYSLLSLAVETGIDSETCLKKALKKYQNRIDNKNSMGSE